MPSIPLLLEETVAQTRRVYESPSLVWKDEQVEATDLAKFEQEAVVTTQFDPRGLKRGVWELYNKGKMRLDCRGCSLARVVAILPKGLKIPEESWGRIFQMFGPPKQGPHGRWNIYWFGAEAPRCFPEDGALLAAEHLNGGYTTICSTEGIFIYRLEEATRVLIHELLHAACLDPAGTIPVREATVETWAEVILVAVRSRGLTTAAGRLWKLQTQWVADTNDRAENKHDVDGEHDYAWRYMNGRAAVYQSLGLALPAPKRHPKSSRFTHPDLGN